MRNPLSYWQTFVLLCIASCVALLNAKDGQAAEPHSQTTLGVRDTKFTRNGSPVFLLGCSYYGALSGDDNCWRADLDDMQNAGVNWIRVWATWAASGKDVSVVDGRTGEPRPELLDRLKSLVADCDRRGLLVDVTLCRGNGKSTPARVQSDAAHLRAVEVLCKSLSPWRNWFLDLGNERNIGDDRFVSFEFLRTLRARVRELDPERLVTASHAGDFSDEELEKYVEYVGVDFLSPHRPREVGSPEQTAARTREWLSVMQKHRRTAPILYQEPLRRGYGVSPELPDFLTDLRGALTGGAAGWCFHNGDQRDKKDRLPQRSFDLHAMRLFVQLDDVERAVVARLNDIVRDVDRGQ